MNPTLLPLALLLLIGCSDKPKVAVEIACPKTGCFDASPAESDSGGIDPQVKHESPGTFRGQTSKPSKPAPDQQDAAVWCVDGICTPHGPPKWDAPPKRTPPLVEGPICMEGHLCDPRNCLETGECKPAQNVVTPKPAKPSQAPCTIQSGCLGWAPSSPSSGPGYIMCAGSNIVEGCPNYPRVEFEHRVWTAQAQMPKDVYYNEEIIVDFHDLQIKVLTQGKRHCYMSDTNDASDIMILCVKSDPKGKREP